MIDHHPAPDLRHLGAAEVGPCELLHERVINFRPTIDGRTLGLRLALPWNSVEQVTIVVAPAAPGTRVLERASAPPEGRCALTHAVVIDRQPDGDPFPKGMAQGRVPDTHDHFELRAHAAAALRAMARVVAVRPNVFTLDHGDPAAFARAVLHAVHAQTPEIVPDAPATLSISLMHDDTSPSHPCFHVRASSGAPPARRVQAAVSAVMRRFSPSVAPFFLPEPPDGRRVQISTTVHLPAAPGSRHAYAAALSAFQAWLATLPPDQRASTEAALAQD